jgi:hypothetical protein
MHTLTTRLDLPLKTGVRTPVALLGGTVTLVEAARDFLIYEDGTSGEVTGGLLRLERGSDVEELRFVSGSPMVQWGHSMAVFGQDSLTLSFFPPGETVQP